MFVNWEELIQRQYQLSYIDFFNKQNSTIRRKICYQYWQIKVCPLLKSIMYSIAQIKSPNRIHFKDEAYKQKHRDNSSKWWSLEENRKKHKAIMNLDLTKNKISSGLKNSVKFQNIIHSNEYSQKRSRILKESNVFMNAVHGKERAKKISKSLKETLQSAEKRKNKSVISKLYFADPNNRKLLSENIKKSAVFNKGVHSAQRSKKLSESSKKYAYRLKTEEFKDKRRKTLMGKKGCNISKDEKHIFIKMQEIYGNGIIQQYTSKEYPFNCDFYIPNQDLYIEYNGNWTHGDEPFDIDNSKHKEIVSMWQDKSLNLKNTNTKRNYYENAVYVWTDLDVRKREIARKNKLNYLEFFNLQQFKDWYMKEKEIL